jgi:hypothetical protein
MGKSVIWKDQAKAQLRAIDQPTALRILHALARYLDTGERISVIFRRWAMEDLGDHILVCNADGSARDAVQLGKAQLWRSRRSYFVKAQLL